MRKFAVMVILLVGVIAPPDVAASFVINSSVHIPALPVLVVAGAWEAQRVAKARDQAMAKDILILHRLRLQAAALTRHTQVLDKLQPHLLGDR
jgi:hypothetical protein